uniref:Cytoplasmic tRNA 2-thiolation protein n=1 Tax=Phaseolus vulgaris TaxID=3885 RepID=T2DND8_PHAVU|nr:cytoplasmic tRNA 2-thiolation protein [Phaseolus vulgaris]
MERKRGGRVCCVCNEARASVKRPKTLQHMCRECFFHAFESEIHHLILNNSLFSPGERVAIGASGGKDSTVLAYVLSKLNRLHNYGLHLFLLSVDEGITGYRDDSLQTVHRNHLQYQLPLQVVSYKDLYGWTMDQIVDVIGFKNNCTFCGVFRRQALDRGAALLKVDKLVTGHNADDIAETVLLNLLRGDVARLSRCTSITTGENGPISRCKPFKYTYEKEIVMYAYFNQVDTFHRMHLLSKCILRVCSRVDQGLGKNRTWSHSRQGKSGENFRILKTTKMPGPGAYQRSGYSCSQKWCKAWGGLDGLNRGLPKLGSGGSRGSVGFENGNGSKVEKSRRGKQSGTLGFGFVLGLNQT